MLTEVGLPDLDGQVLAGRLKAAHPGLRVLFLSMLQGDAHIAGLVAGAGDGYVLKQAAARELLQAIRTAIAAPLARQDIPSRGSPRPCPGLPQKYPVRAGP